MPSHQINIIPSHKIDKEKWDKCIAQASNGLIYGYSFYLDIVSKHWDGLILNDYEVVMPLTWNKKYGIYYLYQPYFAASLGVFGNNLSAEILKIFLEKIPEKYKYYDIYLNHGNLFNLKGFGLYERSNYVLDLNNSYENIAAAFSQNHIRNINKAQKAGCYIDKNILVKKTIQLAKEQSKFSVDNNAYINFSKLYAHLHKKGNAVSYGVFNLKKELISSCVYFFSHNRAYYILAANHPDSRRTGASHLLINDFIKDHAGKNIVLDFEGSIIESIAEFYKKFGAKQEKYAAIKLNKLPGILKLFKK